MDRQYESDVEMNRFTVARKILRRYWTAPTTRRVCSESNTALPFIFLIVLNLLISGCVAQRADVIYKNKLEQRLAALPPPTVYQRQTSFQLDEYAPYRAKGTATL